jgi:preprotein translocase subunit SecE
MATSKKTKNASSTQGKKDNTQQQANKTEDKAANLVKEEKKTPQSTAKNEKKSKKKSSEKGNKPNIFVRMVDFFKGVRHELKKVTWLTKDELLQRTGIVAGVVAIFTFLVWVVDSGLGGLAALLMNK